ncbi:glycosyltransferase family 4 protein [Neobacillus niacini]|uniref:glycosyltransferase family 4 protein n=1 Tax=Neobacillus niacini TaxID=86668 RepID=UPI00285A0C8E|nr:glycosyltransferase family 4 protein [Neobacillus niacini]MDR6999288.1 glycosyltransferase involved in cell wall biosynthesis [Neobacillus niacini]
MTREIGILTHSFVDAYNGQTDKIYGGGLERYLYDLAETILELGWRPVVHQLSQCGSFRKQIEEIEVIGYDYGAQDMVTVFNRMGSEAEGKLIYASFIWHPIQYKNDSIGICHGINWDNPSIPSEHKADVAQNIQGAIRQLKRIVSVDSHFLTFCRSVCTFQDPEQIVLLPNAVDTQKFTPEEKIQKDSNRIHILYPRRISIERGIIPMMLATDRLLATYPQVTIEFVGELIEDSLLTKTFRLWLDAHPHRDRIHYQVYTFGQMVQAYQRADIAVIPTIFSEGTAYSCLEALSCGVPIVSANVGGLNDLIIDRFNGLLVTPTEDRLFEAIRTLIEDLKLRRQIGANARATAKAFDKRIWKEKWTRILSEYIS